LNNIVPFDPNKPYDMKVVIESISDRNQYYEIMPDYAKNIITCFSEVEGRVIGVIAN
jgi:acetyl-CoA carboxylase carboxyltransferase component